MRIVTVLGARPQFIKASVVSCALSRAGLSETIVHTGQHFDANMSAVFFDELEIPAPNHHLGIGGGTHGQNTGRMIEAIEAVLDGVMPDWVMVYGDTDSTLAGAIAASKLKLRVAHVEAGLRSFNRDMPEEINRVLTDHASTLLFAPTDGAVRQLKLEGIEEAQVCWVGDVMYDASLRYGEKAERVSGVLDALGLERKGYVLSTVHRAENTDSPRRLSCIVEGLGECRDVVVLPLHPRTLGRMRSFGVNLPSNVRVIEPVGYLDMVMLEKNARVIATDSGGVQKEAFFYRVPCVTLRAETEWIELVEAGWNTLSPPEDGHGISESIKRAVGVEGMPIRPYGNGDASERIASCLKNWGPVGTRVAAQSLQETPGSLVRAGRPGLTVPGRGGIDERR